MRRHIVTNGDHAANALAAHFPDAEILIWRDVLVEGPVPSGIDDEALADVRARYLSGAFGLDLESVRADFTRRDAAFKSIALNDRVELWFETDLHDQLQLIQFLDRVRRKGNLSAPYLCLAPPPLSSHIGTMAAGLVVVTDVQIDEAAELWNAFRQTTPEEMQRLSKETGALPEARAAFARLLEEFPSPKDGLGRIERQALLAIRDGAITPGHAFGHYQQTEPAPFLGDLGFYQRLDALAFGENALIRGLPDPIANASRRNESVEYTHTPIDLTDNGVAVLEGRADRVALTGIDRWIGGVHLTRQHLWRYDPAERTLRRD